MCAQLRTEIGDDREVEGGFEPAGVRSRLVDKPQAVEIPDGMLGLLVAYCHDPGEHGDDVAVCKPGLGMDWEAVQDVVQREFVRAEERVEREGRAAHQELGLRKATNVALLIR